MPQCFFIGHRTVRNDLRSVLEAEIERHISQLGVADFLIGRNGQFDEMAALAVLSAKQRYPNLHLYQLLAYHPAERKPWTWDGIDGTYYPRGLDTVPWRFAILRANQIAIKESDYLIAYAHTPGGAKTILDHALKQKHLQVTLLPQL